MSQEPTEGEGQLYTLGLLEQLHAQCGELWGTSSNLFHRIDKLLRELANPNLHDIPTNLPFRVELWDRHDRHIRWVIAASSSVTIGHCHRELSRPALHAAQRHSSDPPARSQTHLI
jgi:hypothetical protein